MSPDFRGVTNLPARLIAVLLAAGIVAGFAIPPHRLADASSYVMMADSLWYDRDLNYQPEDLARARALHFEDHPAGILPHINGLAYDQFGWQQPGGFWTKSARSARFVVIATGPSTFRVFLSSPLPSAKVTVAETSREVSFRPEAETEIVLSDPQASYRDEQHNFRQSRCSTWRSKPITV